LAVRLAWLGKESKLAWQGVQAGLVRGACLLGEEKELAWQRASHGLVPGLVWRGGKPSPAWEPGFAPSLVRVATLASQGHHSSAQAIWPSAALLAYWCTEKKKPTGPDEPVGFARMETIPKGNQKIP